MRITHDSTFRNYELSASSKSRDGFYIDLLSNLHEQLAFAVKQFPRPLAAHLVIDAPEDDVFSHLSQELKRWSLTQPGNHPTLTPRYFSCLEFRPRKGNRHLHLVVIFNRLEDSGYSLKALRFRLRKLSKTKQVKLHTRKADCLPLLIDHDTGEVIFDEFGQPRRKGSRYYHDLSIERSDAFKRFSYLCKVYTKAEPPRWGHTFSASRLFRKEDTIPVIVEATPSIISFGF